jgi:hypothetical protein
LDSGIIPETAVSEKTRLFTSPSIIGLSMYQPEQFFQPVNDSGREMIG